MNTTSHAVAIVLPIAASIGLLGLLGLPALALRSERGSRCPQRAAREAADAAIAMKPAVPVGAGPLIGTQRRVETKVDLV